MIVATGKSRRDTRWHNADLSWEQMKDKLRKPFRTHETFAEYKAMSKEDKARAKDVGGFVGGKINGGRRKKGSVECRTLITLDLDSARKDAWDSISMWGWTCCVYSTHSHSSATPRLRLVMPIDRPVTAEEYEPIARRVAEYIGIEQLDCTSYEPERLMFWPSAACDGDWVFHEQDEDLLCADEILASYGADEAWRDTRLWPYAKAEQEAVVHEEKVQGDPREKPGIVGLFCRTYDIPEAMDTFLPGVYTAEDTGRYTYAEGTTSSGVVLYSDGLFMYSHHSTDPCGGKLVNAFDLVRIHLFGDADDAIKDGAEVPVTKLPSYIKMSAFAAQDSGVKRQMAEERTAGAEAAFGDLTGAVEGVEGADDGSLRAVIEPDPEWTDKLMVNRKTGECDPTIENAVTILKHDPLLSGLIRYNAFRGEISVVGDLPWRKLHRGIKERCWTDTDDAQLRRYLETVWKYNARQKLDDAVTAVCHELEYDPLKTYLSGLQWDGVERLDTVLIRLFGADDTMYTRAVTRKWLVAAVKRAYEPGCKFDTMLVLVGDQGAGKSQFGAIISKGWFSDSIQRIDNKDAFDQLQGVWIVEVSELSATKKADIEAIKAFFSKTEDRYRKAYGKHTETYKRHCVFLGTTNDRDSIIKDTTGGRRYWPVECHAGREDVVERLDRLRAEVDQLWAEAVVRYRAGEKIYEDTQELLDAATAVQAEFTQEDEMVGQLEDWLNIPIPDDFEELSARERIDYYRDADLQRPLGKGTKLRDKISIIEIRAEFCGEDVSRDGGPNYGNSRHIGTVMRQLKGWEKCSTMRTVYGIQRGYRRVVKNE